MDKLQKYLNNKADAALHDFDEETKAQNRNSERLRAIYAEQDKLWAELEKLEKEQEQCGLVANLLLYGVVEKKQKQYRKLEEEANRILFGKD